jgi:predicted DNA-binding mobile mystery protein A
MTPAERAFRSRRTLDRRFKAAGDLRTYLTVPVKGWIRAIRDSLGMTGAQLAMRMGLAQSSINDLEKAEARGTIQLSSLKRAAEAMNCTLVYAIVPNDSLESILQRQARMVAREHLRPVHQTMLLENQAVSRESANDVLEDYIRTALKHRLIWDKL